MKLELTLLAWSLRKMKKMEEEHGAAPSSKEMRWRWCSSSTSCSGEAPAKGKGLNGGGEEGAPPWLGVRERGCERVRVRERRLGGGSQVLGRSG